jgi:hypothetical protein
MLLRPSESRILWDERTSFGYTEKKEGTTPLMAGQAQVPVMGVIFLVANLLSLRENKTASGPRTKQQMAFATQENTTWKL